jgi:tetratricopeptide (TPR) repeat protein
MTRPATTPPDTEPASAEDLFALGNAFSARGQYNDAIVCFDRVRVLRPFDARVYNNLGAALARVNRLPEALARYREAGALEPGNADVHHNQGCTLEQMHRLEDAVHCYAESVRLNPNADVSYNNMANCLHALGRFEEAHRAYRQAIRIAPRNGMYYRNFVQSKRLAADDPVFISMTQLLRHADMLDAENQAQLHFAYGQSLDDQGRREAAFEHFLKANALKRQTVAYNEALTLDMIHRMPRLIGADLIQAKQGLGDPSPAPIFIVGMPRSGSTLIEQILASHPQVYGVGERPDFAHALSQAIGCPAGEARHIEVDALDQLSAAQLAPLGASYLQRVRESVLDADPARFSRITDKYPFNFIHVGLIHLALPNARIIHSRRAPIETCMSNFSRLFHDVPFSYDLAELGRYYRAYDGLMAHWRAVLPPGVMLDVQYEDLVDDLTGTVRGMLDHCGLPWDERCLEFHRTKRQVITASASQVREPIYRSSLNRWRPSSATLQPLYDALGPDLVAQDYHGADA